MSGTIANSERELSFLLDFAARKARQHQMELFTHTSKGHLRRVSAGALVRVEGCLRAVALLAKAKLPVEVNTISRTILKLTIIACWVGVDDTRAQQVWNKSVADREQGLKRAEPHIEVSDEVRWLSAAAHGEIRSAPLLAKRLEEPLLATALSDVGSSGLFFLMAVAVQGLKGFAEG